MPVTEKWFILMKHCKFFPASLGNMSGFADPSDKLYLKGHDDVLL